jgi:hypothetical protein
MDLLDNYKKAWDNQPEDANKVSSLEIYKLAQSKSSSIVKWIFIIGIAEFVSLNSLYFFIDMDEALKTYEKLGLVNFMFYSGILAYVILFYFLAKFYQNYKRISATATTKILMNNILKTRKTVRNYVIFNVGYIVLVIIVVSMALIRMESGTLKTKQLLITGFLISIAIVFILGLYWLFYQLLYGILLRKLKRNHKELAKLDSLN